MKNTFKKTFVALALAGVLIMGGGTAHADGVGISLNLGDVAVGYYDGYWDHDHHWHRWNNVDHRHAYQHYHGAHYYGRSHTHYSNGGWHSDWHDHH